MDKNMENEMETGIADNSSYGEPMDSKTLNPKPSIFTKQG